MTNSTAADAARTPVDAPRTPREHRRAPRRQPLAVLVTWGVLLALATATLLDVLPLAEPARLLLTFALLAVVLALATWSQLRFWGTLIATSFAPPRFAVAILGASMALLLANFPDSVGLPVRIGLVLVAPVLMVILLTLDDADTVAKLREQLDMQSRGVGSAPSRA